MIKFKDIHIRDFMSIGELYLTFTNGVTNVEAKNGAGKTTIFMALLQCLFNKNIKTEKDTIEQTYNIYTKRPYHITTTFEKNGNTYVVDNNRLDNKITITENGKDITPKGRKQQLNKIESILEFSYSIFTTFYYLSATTLNSIFDVSSDENVIYKFFNIELLNKVERKLKSQLKDLKMESKIVYSNINNLDKQLEALTELQTIDKTALLVEKELLQEALIDIENSKEAKQIKVMENILDNYKNELNSLRLQYTPLKAERDLLAKQFTKFKQGICPTCGGNVKDKTTNLESDILGLDNQMERIIILKDKLNEKKESLVEELNQIKEVFNSRKDNLVNKINNISTQLIVYEKEEEKFAKINENIESIEIQRKEFYKRVAELNNLIGYINVALKVIKSKAITKEYFKQFVLLLNKRIIELSSSVDFDTLILVEEKKGKLDFVFFKDKERKTLQGLSSGEKARVSLLLLFSVLETLNVLSSERLNLLVLDEILGSLDKEGVALLKTLVNRYRDNSSIYLIQHHKEIEDTFFDYTFSNYQKLFLLS